MTYLVDEKCIKCKLTDCVEVCTVDSFYEGENMLVINPEECIDCCVCEPEFTVDAIISDTEDKNEKWLKNNSPITNKSSIIEIPKIRSVDINTYDDLKLAKSYVKAGNWDLAIDYLMISELDDDNPYKIEFEDEMKYHQDERKWYLENNDVYNAPDDLFTFNQDTTEYLVDRFYRQIESPVKMFQI